LRQTEEFVMPEKANPTHRAYAEKREGQRVRWLEIGVAAMHGDGAGFDLYLDRLPVGGFNGKILVKRGEAPAEEPERPASSSSD
jgi:hypothetical protein